MSGNHYSGRKPDPRTTEARHQAVELRARGFSTAEIGHRLGITRQGAWRLLSNYGKEETPPGAIACCLCGGPVVRGGDKLKNNGPVPCLECLRQRPRTSFAVRLKALRLAAGWTQAELARKVRLAPARVKAYERGQAEPKGRSLVTLMNALGTGLVTLGLGKNGPGLERDGQPRRGQLPSKPR